MAGEAKYTTYRVSAVTLRTFWIAMVIGSATVIFKVASDEEWDPATKFWAIVVFFAILAVLVTWVYRSATVVGSESIAIRGLLRTRRILWSDVQAIAVEINPGSFAKSNAPKKIVNLYHRDGRRITLPHLNEKNLENEFGGLQRAVEGTLAAWELGRGQGWVPVAAVQAKAAERARYGVSPWVSGMGWAALSMPLVLVLFIVGLVGELEPPWPLFYLFRPEAFLIVPVLVFLGTSIGSIILRRRARRVPVA